MQSEFYAYSYYKNDDPAAGRRRSNINSVQDYLRSTFILDHTNSDYNMKYVFEIMADGIDIVNTICEITTIVSGAYTFLQNGYKWATGSNAALTDIKLKHIFSKKTLTGITNKYDDFCAAMRTDGFKTSIGSPFSSQINLISVDSKSSAPLFFLFFLNLVETSFNK